MRVKKILKEKGITAKQLAEQIGMSEVGLSVALSENGNPSLSTLRKIATELDVPISDLFEDRKNDGLITCPNCGFSITIEVKK
ncbi:helix-turn-helix protein [anaerobic digester metagenome]|jgi:transcriptional regulator with XRE-family HTH domain|uniref:helix-turn-helix domain-containing protein n=1 Tax=Petrimonas sp. TaxID=2023866 RepID=UPI002FC736D3